MPDHFGFAAQLPQLFRLFGIDGAVLWRGVGPDRPPHAFRWVSPDGSDVVALWLQDGYGSGRRLPSDPQGFADAVERTLDRLGDWIGEMPILFPVGDDHVRLATWLPEAAHALSSRHPAWRCASAVTTITCRAWARPRTRSAARCARPRSRRCWRAWPRRASARSRPRRAPPRC